MPKLGLENLIFLNFSTILKVVSIFSGFESIFWFTTVDFGVSFVIELGSSDSVVGCSGGVDCLDVTGCSKFCFSFSFCE